MNKELNYTKGKWELQRPYIDRPIVIVAGKQRGKRGVIAEIYQAREQLANARLIVLSPRMMEFIQESAKAGYLPAKRFIQTLDSS